MNFNKLTVKAQEAVVDAQNLARGAGNPEVTAEHLLVSLLRQDGGIVGPIFLVIFFASAPDPELKWMYWAGLFVTTADILIALGITAGTESAKRELKGKPGQG